VSEGGIPTRRQVLRAGSEQAADGFQRQTGVTSGLDLRDLFRRDLQPFQKCLMLRRMTLLKQVMPLAHGCLIQANVAEQFYPLGFAHVGIWRDALLLLIGTGVRLKGEVVDGSRDCSTDQGAGGQIRLI
jgi:hypothetical protein